MFDANMLMSLMGNMGGGNGGSGINPQMLMSLLQNQNASTNNDAMGIISQLMTGGLGNNQNSADNASGNQADIGNMLGGIMKGGSPDIMQLVNAMGMFNQNKKSPPTEKVVDVNKAIFSLMKSNNG